MKGSKRPLLGGSSRWNTHPPRHVGQEWWRKVPSPPNLHHCWIHHWKAIVEHHMKDTFPNGGKLMESIAKHWYVYIYMYCMYTYYTYIHVIYIYILYNLYNISLTTQKAECFKNFLRANFGPQDPKHPAFTSWAWMRIWFRRSLGIGSVGQICWRKICTKIVLSIVVCGSRFFFGW